MATRRTTRSMSREPGSSRSTKPAKRRAAPTLDPVIDLTLSDDDDPDIVQVAGPSKATSRIHKPRDDGQRVLIELNDPPQPKPGPALSRTGSRVLAELNKSVNDKENARDSGAVPSVDPGLEVISVAAPMVEPRPVANPTPAGDQVPAEPVPGPAQPEVEVVDPLARVLEIVPDVDLEHAQKLIDAHIATYGPEKVVQPVLHLLLEDPSYPKAQRNKGKRKADVEAEANNKKIKIDYASADRPFAGSNAYFEAAVTQLTVDYPYIPKADLRRFLLDRNSLYAPTFLFIREEEKKPLSERPYKLKKSATPNKGKGRAVEYEDDELAREVKWVKEFVTGNFAPVADEDDGDGSLEAPEGEGVECGCCFGEYRFDTMIQCPDAHLFCISCVRAYAGTKLADGHADIPCPSSSDPPCKMHFSESELRRALKEGQMDLWGRVRARRDLESAKIDGLEECPFCDYACVVENPDEKLFRCARVEECGEVSCRKCKKRDHLPKSCKEAEQDNVLDAQHAVEEAMTKALMRNCPKCSKAFVKETGCNKMSCPYCHTLSCYVCRQIIIGYDHFDQMPGGQRRPAGNKAGKCPLWDEGQNVELRHRAEVEAAAKRALAEVRAANPEVDAQAIKVDMPAPPPQPRGHVHGGPAPVLGHFHGVHAVPMAGHGWNGAQFVHVPPPPVFPAAHHHYHHHPPPPPPPPPVVYHHHHHDYEDDMWDEDEDDEEEEMMRLLEQEEEARRVRIQAEREQARAQQAALLAEERILRNLERQQAEMREHVRRMAALRPPPAPVPRARRR
ncbi:hypothetical protein EXIGLDRAFT_636660 [Exidia glandulosa HHB12029]|uniref:RING-type domain-containing protein n=1 Tax=Exidia glandulosa HHB12029 TaxID=1314781 RepID=A0A165Q3D1_EXIGL|nr:hypothetical protein EXIGLDRAFT_636660 [Exidia glandulosa HHB12029]